MRWIAPIDRRICSKKMFSSRRNGGLGRIQTNVPVGHKTNQAQFLILLAVAENAVVLLK